MPTPDPRRPGRRHHLHRRHDATMRIRVGAFEIRKTGASRYDLRDPYHFAIALSWPKFALLFLCLNLAINVVFALLYIAQPGAIANAHPGAFADAFFFSMETLATVGYGAMSPGTYYGHTVAAVEIITGMAFTAIMTGLTFVRFSRARAKILYADRAVVAHYNGCPTLMIRIGNGRASLLTDVQARVSVLIGEHTREGQFYRRVHDLKLSRARLPMFALTWTIMHPIDATSPLHGYDSESFREADVRLFLALEARDLTLDATVRDMRDYPANTVVFGMRYADAVSIDEQGRATADLRRIGLLEEDTGTTFEPFIVGDQPAEDVAG
ncbi:MAG: ATP-sensitive inward rectifier potassium channel 10 [Alphaproteobacteria bacterium]|nr:ATP-sensitive inward rectifier potassium channel 10 [Alphaproteobacteria bacterium]